MAYGGVQRYLDNRHQAVDVASVSLNVTWTWSIFPLWSVSNIWMLDIVGTVLSTVTEKLLLGELFDAASVAATV